NAPHDSLTAPHERRNIDQKLCEHGRRSREQGARIQYSHVSHSCMFGVVEKEQAARERSILRKFNQREVRRHESGLVLLKRSAGQLIGRAQNDRDVMMPWLLFLESPRIDLSLASARYNDLEYLLDECPGRQKPAYLSSHGNVWRPGPIPGFGHGSIQTLEV